MDIPDLKQGMRIAYLNHRLKSVGIYKVSRWQAKTFRVELTRCNEPGHFFWVGLSEICLPEFMWNHMPTVYYNIFTGEVANPI